VSQHFLILSGRLLLTALVPLMLGIALDFYLIARIILGQTVLSFVLASVLFVFVTGLWFVFPRWHQRAKRH